MTDDSAVASSGMHQHIALPSSLRMDARIHGSEKEVDDVKKVKVEVAASEGAPIQCSRERPWFGPCPRSSGWLVPSPAESELISAVVEPAAGIVWSRLLHRMGPGWLMQLCCSSGPTCPPRVWICLVTGLRHGRDLCFARALPRYRKLFPGLTLHVYVAPAEHEEWLTHFRRNGISEEAGVILMQGGSSPGEQVRADPRDAKCRLT